MQEDPTWTEPFEKLNHAIMEVKDSSSDTAWITPEVSTAPPPTFPRLLRIAASMLEMALRGPQLAGVRGTHDQKSRRTLLMHDLISTPEGELIVDIELQRPPYPSDTFNLQVRMVSERELPKGLQVGLAWGEVERTEPLGPTGQAILGDLPLQYLYLPEDEEPPSQLLLSFYVT